MPISASTATSSGRMETRAGRCLSLARERRTPSLLFRSEQVAQPTITPASRVSVCGGCHDHRQLAPRPRLPLAVLVVPAPPVAGLVASFGSAVEPLIHAPE